jgi:hypothetical protein
MSRGRNFSKEIMYTLMREELSREVAPNSDPSNEEKVPARSGSAPGEIEVFDMVDKEGKQFTRILIGRKREHLVIKKVPPKKINDTHCKREQRHKNKNCSLSQEKLKRRGRKKQ